MKARGEDFTVSGDENEQLELREWAWLGEKLRAKWPARFLELLIALEDYIATVSFAEAMLEKAEAKLERAFGGAAS